MDERVARPRRALVGVAAMALGATGLVGGLAGMASAHEGTEPEEVHDNLNCADIAELVGSDQTWTESKYEGFPDEEGEYELVLSDRGTPDDESDDAVVTIIVTGPKNFDWESTVGIDAVFVKGGNAEDLGSYLYYFDGAELTEDVDYTVPPYENPEKNAISHITFCWDDEGGGTTTTTEASTTSTTEATTTSTTEAPTTSTTEAPTTSSSSTTVAPTTPTTAPTTTISSGGGLPVTGSNTGLLAALGGGLLLAGGIFLVARRQLWRRPI